MTDLNLQATGKLADKNTIRNDPIMNGLLTKSPQEVFTWVDANVTDMDSAKELLKRLAAAVSWLLKE